MKSTLLLIVFFVLITGFPMAVSAAVLDAPQGRAEGLRGIYYDATGDPITRDERNADIAAIRTDRTVAFRWTEQKPAPVESDFFTSEWKGDLRPPVTGTYSFRVISDGATAVWINDDLLIEGTPSELTERHKGVHEFSITSDQFFEVGRTYHLRIKSRHARTNGIAQLWWRTPDNQWEIVPSSFLSTEAPPSVLPFGRGGGVSTTITQYVDSARYTVTRTDPTVAVDLPSDFQNKGNFRFNVSWSGEIEPRVSTFYRFYTSADGPATLSLQGEDGRAAIDYDKEGPNEQHTASVFLRAGKRYAFTMTYRQESDTAHARLLWSNAVEQRKELIPRSQLHSTLRAQTPPKKQGTGLPGQYFNGENFEQPAFARLDPDINFNWEKKSPKPGSLNNAHYSVRWEGEIEAQKTDFYQFSSRVDDRIKVVIDGHTVLDTSRVRAGKTSFALPILLESGRRYPVMIEYAQYIDTAYINLFWSASDGKRGVVPAETLYGTLTPLAGMGLHGEYFAGENFDTLKATHPAEQINFDWRESAPDPAVPADHFSVRWTGWIEPPASDTYTFTVRVDDGVRIWIDDSPLLNEWRRVSRYMVEFRFEKRLEKGKLHPIRIEYFESDSPAGIQLFWERSGRTREPVPRNALYPTPIVSPPSQTATVSGTGTGLYAEYFSDPNLGSLAASRIDSNIDFLWDYNAPVSSLPRDWFSARWAGWIEAPQSADYTFTVRVDDGIRLWIGEEKLIDQWHRVSTYPTEYRAKRFLKQGRYPIRVEFYEEDSPAGIRLFWEYANRAQEVVPARFLYPAPEPIQPPGNGTGLRGRYYKGSNTADELALPYPVVERTDPSVGFSWGLGSPDFHVPGDDFSARWDGFIQPRYTGTYTFYLTADNDATLFIDDKPITTSTTALITTGSDINREYSTTKTLSRDQLYYIRIIYRENTGDARVHFSWSHDRIPKEIVPRVQLYSPGTSILAPLGL